MKGQQAIRKWRRVCARIHGAAPHVAREDGTSGSGFVLGFGLSSAAARLKFAGVAEREKQGKVEP